MLINFMWHRVATNPKPNETDGLLDFNVDFLDKIPIQWSVLGGVLIAGAVVYGVGHSRIPSPAAGDKAAPATEQRLSAAPAVPAEAVRALAPVLGEPEGAPDGARRRDHQPQLPPALGRPRLRAPAARQGHGAARDRPARGVGGDPRRGGGRHRPARARVRAGPRLPRHGVRRGPPGRAGGAAARGSRRSPRRCARSMPAGELPATFDAFAVRRAVPADRRERGAAAAAGLRRARGRRARHPRGARGSRARAGPVPQRPAEREPARRRPAAADPRLGVRGHGRPLLRPRQPRGQQRLHRGRRRGAAGRLLARRLHAPAARRAAADAA